MCVSLDSQTELFSQTYLPLPEKSLIGYAWSNEFLSTRFDKFGVPHLSCGLDKLDWIELQKINHETFRDCNLKKTVFTLKTPLERTTSGDHDTAADLQKSQTIDSGISQGLASNLVFPVPTYRVFLAMYGSCGIFLMSWQSVTAFFAGSMKISKPVKWFFKKSSQLP